MHCEFVASRQPVSFIADDVIETFRARRNSAGGHERQKAAEFLEVRGLTLSEFRYWKKDLS
jgi:serine kinase of HPr protein (carbohydrate metabolism regulator)